MSEFGPGETVATHRWSRVMYWPLTIAALVFLITYTIHVIGQVHGEARVVTTTIIGLTWVLFVVDYLGRLLLAKPRGLWVRSHLAALATVFIPAIRPVRLLDAFTRIASFRRTRGTSLRANLLIYGVGSALLMIWYVALIVLEFERHAPGATIVNFGDAVWWAFCTVTTVGYGDYTPVTVIGRVYGVLLMAGGVVLVGLIVATISSWILDAAQHGGIHRIRLDVPATPHGSHGAHRSTPDAPADASAPPSEEDGTGKGER